MAEYQKREIVGELPEGTNTIGNINMAKGKTILYDNSSAANSIQTIRTVTGGKTYYLLTAGLMYVSTTGGAEAQLYLNNSSSTILDFRARITATYNIYDSNSITITFPHPIPIAAGVAIKVESNNTNLNAFGWIIGWEE